MNINLVEYKPGVIPMSLDDEEKLIFPYKVGDSAK